MKYKQRRTVDASDFTLAELALISSTFDGRLREKALALAQAQASSFYYTPAKPCRRGHQLRYVRNNRCVFCNRRNHTSSMRRRRERA